MRGVGTKVVICILIAMNVTLWRHYNDLDERVRANGNLDRAVFKAQVEAFGVHARAINSLTDTILEAMRAHDAAASK